MAWWVLIVVIVTLVAIITRPRGLGEPWTAAAGAAAMVLLGVVSPGDVVAVLRETADVLLFLLGMMVLTWLVEQAGVFDRLAELVAGLASGSGRRLFGLVFLLAAVVTALLSLDVTVLVLTPVIYALATRRRLDALPFMFACTFVANTGSLLLPISNLTNLLAYSQLGLGFGAFAARMWLPNLAAVVVNLGVFLWLFRARLPDRFDPAPAALPPADWWFRAAVVALTATLAALVALGLAHRPLAWAALVGGGLLLLIGLASRRIHLGEAAAAVSWSLFVFVVAMFLIVRGFEHAWFAGLDLRLPTRPLPALLLAVGSTALGSNIVNNVPMALLALSFVARTHGPVREALAYGTLVGANVGPTLTTYGSLATMLWLTLIRKRGLDVSTAEYLRVALLTTPAVVLAATLALWMVLR